MPEHPGEHGDFHTMPRHPSRGRESAPWERGEDGGFGRPPRRPDPDFLKARIAEADLGELIKMAGRMAHRCPDGGQNRSQTLVLSILAGRESLPQRELQQMLGVQPGSMSELVTKLERKGWLTRKPAKDRRGNLLRITAEGRKAIPTDGMDGEDDRFNALTTDQQDELSALLRALLTDWVERAGGESRGVPPQGGAMTRV